MLSLDSPLIQNIYTAGFSEKKANFIKRMVVILDAIYHNEYENLDYDNSIYEEGCYIDCSQFDYPDYKFWLTIDKNKKRLHSQINKKEGCPYMFGCYIFYDNDEPNIIPYHMADWAAPIGVDDDKM